MNRSSFVSCDEQFRFCCENILEMIRIILHIPRSVTRFGEIYTLAKI